MSKTKDPGAVAKLIRRLSGREASLVRQSDGTIRLKKGSEASTRIDTAVVSEAIARGLVEERDAGRLVLSQTGTAFLRRHLASGDAFAAQHQARVPTRAHGIAGEQSYVIVNQDESPLAWLRRRKGRDGRPFVDAAAYEAGERLRADFTRGQMMPRVTANWTAAVADARRDGSGGLVDLTDAVLAARQRVSRALEAVGPELAGLLVDFCCFLKKIEEIERERQWPARSAKVVLKLALAALARHYGLAPKAKGPPRSIGIRQWGAENYRPTID